ncbi:hypothetical protein HanHA300_Chr04g0130431 [Helianthus annuus]|nr:hypothetical protein HanHA300_Chr04g0130431 [Helianthus annuus]KAJ0596500.1 hypothetical protein HanHA89_Chr04g0143471 [Helianthus annuus]KAJ0757160.1 hypothetical protein HanLR1_Chr04g0135391 [Helianthus annuus]KAJ0760884.1 hypothetical protein HanOQP8_Chr04g0143161 [Helianthus annuus]
MINLNIITKTIFIQYRILFLYTFTRCAIGSPHLIAFFWISLRSSSSLKTKDATTCKIKKMKIFGPR